MKHYFVPILQKFEWQQPVEDKDLSSPPSSPSKGKRYIVASSPTGYWTGHEGDIAIYDGSSWFFFAKKEGMVTYVKDEDNIYYFNGTSWVLLTSGGGAAHNILSTTHPDALVAAVVAGDIIYGNSTPKWARRAKKNDGDVLTLISGFPDWQAPSFAGYGKDIVDENFDGLSLGSIGGQGSYPDAGTWDDDSGTSCTAEVAVKSGSDYMLRLTDNSGSVSADCALQMDDNILWGIIKFKMRTSLTTKRSFFDIKEGGKGSSDYFRISFENDGGIDFYDGSSYTNLRAYAANTWYSVIIYFDCLARYATVFIDGTFEIRKALTNVDYIDAIRIITGGGFSGFTFDIDDLLIVNLNKKCG